MWPVGFGVGFRAEGTSLFLWFGGLISVCGFRWRLPWSGVRVMPAWARHCCAVST